MVDGSIGVFFFNDTATTEIYTLSLHDALPIVARVRELGWSIALDDVGADPMSLAFMPLLRPDVVKLDLRLVQEDRKSTRLNSSHANISYAVFCLKKKKKYNNADYTSSRKHSFR